MRPIEVVVSAENLATHGWMSRVFYRSWRKIMGFPPLIVVHGADKEPEHEYFSEAAADGRIIRAKNWRGRNGHEYAPRNTIGSLVEASKVVQSDMIMLCDPDMLVRRRFDIPHLENSIGFDRVGYMDASRDWTWCDGVRSMDDCHATDEPGIGGVPYLVPRKFWSVFASQWLKELDRFPCDKSDLGWVSIMWSAVFAARRLQIPITPTTFASLNNYGSSLPASHVSRPMLHYCYLDKHHHDLEHVVSQSPPPGTIDAMVVDLIRRFSMTVMTGQPLLVSLTPDGGRDVRVDTPWIRLHEVTAADGTVVSRDVEFPEPPRPVPMPVHRRRGLGDLVAAVTRRLGLRHCGSCQKRRQRLNAMTGPILAAIAAGALGVMAGFLLCDWLSGRW